MSFQKPYSYNKKLKNAFLRTLLSKVPALISITVDGLDSSFVRNNSDTLTSIIKKQVNLFYNNPDYYESMTPLLSLSYKIDSNTGTVGMASAGKDTEGSQWFVTTGNYPHLNGRYTIFGKVIKALNVVFKIDQNDKILNVTLIK